MKGYIAKNKIAELKQLYLAPLPSSRTGALYNAFSYPTKISPEAIGIFIACHTEIGATVLDPFAGSGTTGLGAKLADKPTQYMIDTAKALKLNPKWGKRKAVLYELSTLGSFVSETMSTPPETSEFENAALELIHQTEAELNNIYAIKDNAGGQGIIRHVIWSDVLSCPQCSEEITFWSAVVRQEPLTLEQDFICPHCGFADDIGKIKRATETVWDEVLQQSHEQKKRVPVKVYGKTGKKTWSRLITEDEKKDIRSILTAFPLNSFPKHQIRWGVLYRAGYHHGITHLHHFYTKRNAQVFSALWKNIQTFPPSLQSALKLLLLSYNSSHSTLMTRVVVKKNSSDFVITGSQSGVLYISGLPIEKNIFEGLRRKIKTFKQAFDLMHKSASQVQVINASSTKLNLADESVDYIFTDPPFGDYIPYSEINQLNEFWLGRLTDQHNEAIVNKAQEKGITEYHIIMQAVFSEMQRVLKPKGSLSLVFHSAQAEIWRALIGAYQRAGFQVLTSSILDKIQNSFKQTNSTVKVQGDPLLLLTKSTASGKVLSKDDPSEKALIRELIDSAFMNSENLEEQKPERLYSRYINACLTRGNPVWLDAVEFYKLIKDELLRLQFTL